METYLQRQLNKYRKDCKAEIEWTSLAIESYKMQFKAEVMNHMVHRFNYMRLSIEPDRKSIVASIVHRLKYSDNAQKFLLWQLQNLYFHLKNLKIDLKQLYSSSFNLA